MARYNRQPRGGSKPFDNSAEWERTRKDMTERNNEKIRSDIFVFMH